jgi:hypothetical protein
VCRTRAVYGEVGPKGCPQKTDTTDNLDVVVQDLYRGSGGFLPQSLPDILPDLAIKLMVSRDIEHWDRPVAKMPYGLNPCMNVPSQDQQLSVRVGFDQKPCHAILWQEFQMQVRGDLDSQAYSTNTGMNAPALFRM